MDPIPLPDFDNFLSRFKLKFSPDKVDTMVVQAIALLDDLDKEINIYAMRVKVRVMNFQSLSFTHPGFCRNGTDGISLKWQKSSPTTLPTPKSSDIWVSKSLSLTRPNSLFL
jgi:hypothetical protein